MEHVLFSSVFSKLRICVGRSFSMCSHDPISEPTKIGSLKTDGACERVFERVKKTRQVIFVFRAEIQTWPKIVVSKVQCNPNMKFKMKFTSKTCIVCKMEKNHKIFLLIVISVYHMLFYQIKIMSIEIQ